MVLTLNNVTDAMKGAKLSTRDHADIKSGLDGVMKNLSVLAGYDPDLIYEQLDDLARDIASSYPSLTLEEVRLAGKAGVAGELGEGKKPTYASMMRWVDAYTKHPMTKDAARISAKRAKETPRLTPEQGLAQMRKTMPALARKRWDDIRTNGAFGKATLPHVSAQIYDWLGEEGVLRLTPEERTIATKKGTSEVRKSSVWDLEHLEVGKALIRTRTKHYALEEWMRDLFNAGGQLTLPAEVRRIYE